MTSYIAYLRKDRDSDYGVEFPDLPGCFSAGSTMEEAKAMAAEALAGHVSVLQSEEFSVPAPSTMDQFGGDLNRGDAVMFLVDLDPSLLKAERVNVMIPRNLLGRIDAVAGSGNRSRYLVEAAEQRLAGCIPR
jgi:predicted RNase H-like HicB family nuclease